MRQRRRNLQEKFLPPASEVPAVAKPPPTKPPPFQSRPTVEFRHVKLADLKIPDDIYQRPSSSRFVKAIVDEGWDEGLQTVILVSAETNNVLDGGHRVRAARRLEIDQLPALVYHGLTLEQEAKYFVRLNSRRRLVGLRHRQKAAIQYRDPEALNVQSIINALQPKKIPLQTVTAAEGKYPGVLARLVPVLTKMDTKAFSRDFVSGLVHLAGTHPGGLDEEMKSRLIEPGMYRRCSEMIKQEMRRHMEAHGRTALPTDWSVKAEGILQALNTKPALVPRETLVA